ncbi:MAG TPA: hypothetical protein VH591_15910 [Ktedonobacterales bacterium]|jgi:hypothetical protein
MEGKSDKAGSARHAITDVYDEERRTFLVHFPLWYIIALGLSGVIVLGLTGFLGRPQSNYAYDAIFRQPWVLYLWLCLLVLTLEVAVLRDASVRLYRLAVVAITLIAMIIVLITFFYGIPFGELLNSLLDQLFHLRVAVEQLVSSPWFYALLNFGVLAVYALDSGRRWLRRARGLAPNRRVDIGLGETSQAKRLPGMQQLVAGDLLAGALLCVALAIIFRPDIVATFWHLTNSSVFTNGCTVSWPLGSCTPPGLGKADPPTLTFIDTILALIALPTGLLVLALAGAVSGLAALGGVQRESSVSRPLPSSIKEQSSTQAISEHVSRTLLDTLLAALNRGGGGGQSTATAAEVASESLLLPLRNVLWPPLIFLGVAAVAQAATHIQTYFHGVKSLTDEALLLVTATPWAVVSAVSIVIALALIVFHGRIAENTFRFLGLVAFIGLLTAWIYSLALWSFNQLLLLLGASTRHPFDPPAWNTVLSLGALLIFGTIYFAGRLRRPPGEPANIGGSS